MRLHDAYGKSAGNIDVVLVSLDAYGRVADFGALEVQAVYIPGNVSGPFRYYMENPPTRYAMEWPSKGYPSPDYLSSSRKRLAPQLMFKGGILNAWGKKVAVAVQRPFFATLPQLPRVSRSEAELAWMIYDLERNAAENRYQLLLAEIVYTRFKPALDEITVPTAGPINRFVQTLERRLKRGSCSEPQKSRKYRRRSNHRQTSWSRSDYAPALLLDEHRPCCQRRVSAPA